MHLAEQLISVTHDDDIYARLFIGTHERKVDAIRANPCCCQMCVPDIDLSEWLRELVVVLDFVDVDYLVRLRAFDNQVLLGGELNLRDRMSRIELDSHVILLVPLFHVEGIC